MSTNWSLFSGLRRFSTVPSGSFAKASSVGAKTVRGPLPLRASTRPPALRAAVSVLKEPAATAVSTRSFFSGFSAVTSVVQATRAVRVVAITFIFFVVGFVVFRFSCERKSWRRVSRDPHGRVSRGSEGGEPSVGPEDLSGHECRALAEEEVNQVGDFSRVPDAIERVATI